MIVTVDANIVISALINSAGQEFNILTSGNQEIEFISSSFIIEELVKKVHKIAELTHNSVLDIKRQLQLLTETFLLVNEKDISNQALERAKNLIHGLDVNDYLYLAVTIYFDSLLWTGDLKLSRGLKRKG